MHKFIKKISILGLLCIFSSGCQKETNAVVDVANSNTVNIPTMTESEVEVLNDTQWEELERRCLGQSHPTCTLMSENRSDNEKIRDLNKSYKEASDAMDRFNAEK